MDLFSKVTIVNNVCIVALLVFVFINRKHIFKNNASGGTNYFQLWLLATLFSMFYMPVDGDVYNGYVSYNDYVISGVRYHMEDIYFWLMDHLPHNFYIYRFVIWGTASLFMVLTFKRLDCQSPFAMLVFISSCLIVCYYYLRNVLGFSILYYVVACICTYNKTTTARLMVDFVKYGLLLVATYFLHRSMPLYYAFVLLALFIPSNRYLIVLIVLLLTAIKFLLPSFVSQIMSSPILSQETVDLGAGYLEHSEGFAFNLMGRLMRFFWLLPYIFIMTHAALFIQGKSKADKRMNKPVETFLLISLFLFSSSFLFADTYSYSLHLRLLHTSFMPMMFFITKYLEDKRDKTVGHVFSFLLLTYYGMMLVSRIF